MFPAISEIERRRVRLGLTQIRLAKLSGVDQDVISRIERRVIRDPSYTTVKKLFEALDAFQIDGHENKNDELTAEKIMSHTIVSVKPSDYTDYAWELMKHKQFSQLPVIDSAGKVIGGILEKDLARISNIDLASKTRVEDVMSDGFPIVGKSKGISKLRSILLEANEQAVIVMEKGRAIGIITKADLIDSVFARQPQLLK